MKKLTAVCDLCVDRISVMCDAVQLYLNNTQMFADIKPWFSNLITATKLVTHLVYFTLSQVIKDTRNIDLK